MINPFLHYSTIMDGRKGPMRFIDEDFENWAGTLSGNTSVSYISNILLLAEKPNKYCFIETFFYVLISTQYHFLRFEHSSQERLVEYKKL